jgi:hypothetical protein
MPECRGIIIPVSAFSPLVNCVSPSSAFWHQAQSAVHLAMDSPGIAKLCEECCRGKVLLQGLNADLLLTSRYEKPAVVTSMVM